MTNNFILKSNHNNIKNLSKAKANNTAATTNTTSGYNHTAKFDSKQLNLPLNSQQRVYYSAWKEANKKVNEDKIKMSQINEEMSKLYDVKIGGFALLFPFNKLTENLSVEQYKTQNVKNPTRPNYTKMMISEGEW